MIMNCLNGRRPWQDGGSGLWEEEVQRMQAGPERKGWGLCGKLEQSVSITQAWTVAEWEVVMDQGRLPLSWKKGTEGTSLDGRAMSEPRLD